MPCGHGGGNLPRGGVRKRGKKIYGVQFHPEVVHTEYGENILKNFLYEVCKAKGDWTMSGFVEEQVAALKKKSAIKSAVRDERRRGFRRGGYLIHRAAGDNLTCVFVDHGLLRKYEADEVMSVFKDKLGMNLIKADAAEQFLSKLKGVSDPERKRKIIGEEFIRTFEKISKQIGAVDFLVQGTIYPDVIESGKENPP